MKLKNSRTTRHSAISNLFRRGEKTPPSSASKSDASKKPNSDSSSDDPLLASPISTMSVQTTGGTTDILKGAPTNKTVSENQIDTILPDYITHMFNLRQIAEEKNPYVAFELLPDNYAVSKSKKLVHLENRIKDRNTLTGTVLIKGIRAEFVKGKPDGRKIILTNINDKNKNKLLVDGAKSPRLDMNNTMAEEQKALKIVVPPTVSIKNDLKVDIPTALTEKDVLPSDDKSKRSDVKKGEKEEDIFRPRYATITYHLQCNQCLLHNLTSTQNNPCHDPFRNLSHPSLNGIVAFVHKPTREVIYRKNWCWYTLAGYDKLTAVYEHDWCFRDDFKLWRKEHRWERNPTVRKEKKKKVKMEYGIWRFLYMAFACGFLTVIVRSARLVVGLGKLGYVCTGARFVYRRISHYLIRVILCR